MESRVIKIAVAPAGADLFDELITTIEIEDEAAGEYLVIEQQLEGCGKIKVSPEEWPALRAAINRMIKECRDEAKSPAG